MALFAVTVVTIWMMDIIEDHRQTAMAKQITDAMKQESEMIIIERLLDVQKILYPTGTMKPRGA